MRAPISRRGFLKVSAAGGAALVLGFRVTDARRAPAATDTPADPAQADAPFVPNAYLRIDANGLVTVLVHRSEMGQRVDTALPMIVADELEVDWASVRIEHAPPDPVYGDQSTGGSVSIRFSYWPLREAGAVARTMLVAAAASAWGVDPGECRAEGGAVLHEASGRRLAYGDLVEAASRLPVPAVEEVTLKDPADFRIIGGHVGDVNALAYSTGRATYASDLRLPGMLTAVIARSPMIGEGLRSFDAAPALAVDGVRHVVAVSSGVAVVADTTWAALQGREALVVTWDEGDATLDSAAIREAAAAGIAMREEPGLLEAVYEIPYLAHAPLEPMTCVADVREGRCEVWAPSQDRQDAQRAAASVTGFDLAAVTVHVPLIGGAFGRRLQSDYVREAVEISAAVGSPVKVFWTREDDLRHDFYHPFSLSYRSARPDAPAIPEGYTVESGPLPTGAWRSVANFTEAFATGCFLDELAVAAGRDSLELHREVYAGTPLRPALELAAEKAGWGEPLAEGRGRGLAVHNTFGVTPSAMVVEVSMSDGQIRVERVVCAVDCGLMIDPDGVGAQLEGGIVFALSAALHGEITVREGRVEQSSFRDYPILRMDEMPRIEIHHVPSDDPPRGVGEMGVPPTAPALLNAVYAATGKRIRHLPIRAEDLA